MKTIERMAELLERREPYDHAQAQVAHQKSAQIFPVPDEPATRAGDPRPSSPERFGPRETGGTGLRVENPAAPFKPTIKIDREHLRRQSLAIPEGDRTPNTETFRRIKRQVLARAAVSSPGNPSNLVLVTSALPGEGKSFCALSLAISIAMEMDRTVLLVDADVAKPSIPSMLGLKAGPGLLDILVDHRIDLAEVLCKTDIGKLTVLPAGTAHGQATELLGSHAMNNLLQEMAQRYSDRIVIFDSPPLLAASEAGVLTAKVGQIVVVVEAGKTSEAQLGVALGRIETGNVTGMLLNKAGAPAMRYDYGEYGYQPR